MEPESDPQRTTPISETKIVNPTSHQYCPYMPPVERSKMKCHAVMRTNPMVPRIPPSNKPDPNSRRITRHQSRSVISPSAMARMIKVVACDPELPPLDM